MLLISRMGYWHAVARACVSLYRFYPEIKLLPHQQPHNSVVHELDPATPAEESS